MKGLTTKEVNKLKEQGKTNYIKNKASKSVPEIIISNLCTYFNLIFLILGILVIITGNFKNLIFLPVVIINTLIGIFQQIKSKRILDKLALLDISSYKTIRDGEEKSVLSTELVLGDVIKLESGNQIPADAEVIEGVASVNESLLTGEVDEIDKKEGSELKSGSFVVSGSVYAKLTHVGEDSYVSKLSSEAKQIKEKKTEMIKDIEKIIKVAGIIIIPIGLLLLYQSMVTNGNSFNEAIPSMVGAVTGMIPEGLYLLVTIALALSSARLAKVKVLLHDMRSIESLARVDVLCLDKTGTITSNVMYVTDIYSKDDNKANYEEILSKYINTVTDNNITIEALRRHYNKFDKMDAKEVIPFNSKTKCSCIKTKDATYKLGAPEFLLSKEDLKGSEDIINIFANEGKRVLVFTKSSNNKDKALLFIALKNELRENAKETFTYLQEQGIEIKVISGDNPVTVSNVAKDANIINSERYVDCTTLDTDEKIKEAVKVYTIFGRVKPEQKKLIVDAIKALDKKVAMTGDGVNDILAMKEADCSIAMGEGSEAARNSAQVVLLDSDFSHMKNIIFEGRRNINNITRSATLFIYKNIFSVLLAIFSIIAAFNYPLKATQISFISFFNIGLPAFLLTFEYNIKKQEGLFIKNVFVNAFPAALTSFTAIIALIFFAEMFGIDEHEVATTSIYLISVIGFNILWLISRPINNFHRMIFAICILGILLTTRFLGIAFDIRDISIKATVLCILFALAEMSVIRDFAYFLDQVDKRLSDKFKERIKNKYIKSI